MRRTGVILLTAVVAVGIVTAAGAGQSFESKVTIHFDDNGNIFTGLVKSPKDKCERNRTVRLFRTPLKGDPIQVGSDTSNVNGEWTVDLNLVVNGQDYFAKAKRRVLDSGICKNDRSRDVNVSA